MPDGTTYFCFAKVQLQPIERLDRARHGVLDRPGHPRRERQVPGLRRCPPRTCARDAVPTGISCRFCERTDCNQRAAAELPLRLRLRRVHEEGLLLLSRSWFTRPARTPARAAAATATDSTHARHLRSSIRPGLRGAGRYPRRRPGPLRRGGPRPNGAVAEVNQALAGQLRPRRDRGRLPREGGSDVVLHTHGRLPVSRVVLVGTGPRERTDAEVLRQAAGRGVKAAQRLGPVGGDGGPGESGRVAGPGGRGRGAGRLPLRPVPDRGPRGEGPASCEGGPAAPPRRRGESRALEGRAGRALQIAEAANFARTLVNEPAGHLTPEVLADEAARHGAKDGGLEVRSAGRSEMKKLKMGMFSAVGQGSTEEPRLIQVVYPPKKARRREAPGRWRWWARRSPSTRAACRSRPPRAWWT